ncbi:hypothetical protein [Breznakia pachnodae]|uniref:Uncharacterized protein n=1 Tax=Breznakia pachnodae TaxID=265178 RepID=A0ABU0E6M8_9FIRM|nr:hypothetical protein [Breznakia pachnodae]MDQ0362562.1 hypothetical protein [Breznakia pachnodae]
MSKDGLIKDEEFSNEIGFRFGTTSRGRTASYVKPELFTPVTEESYRKQRASLILGCSGYGKSRGDIYLLCYSLTKEIYRLQKRLPRKQKKVLKKLLFGFHYIEAFVYITKVVKVDVKELKRRRKNHDPDD